MDQQESKLRLIPANWMCFELDPASYFGQTEEEVRDVGLRLCPIFSRAPRQIRRQLNLLMAGPMPEKILPHVIKKYKECKGRIQWPRSLQNKPGVHPFVAVTILCLHQKPPVILDVGGVHVDVRKQVPWSERADFRQVMGWACHRYAGYTTMKLSHTPLFDYLSVNDRPSSVYRTIERVARKLKRAASQMGLELRAA